MIGLLHRILMTGVALKREPDVYIGGRQDTYLERWHVIPRNPVFNVYLHRFLRSDDDRALHDHPWLNLSVLLAGAYTEHTIRAGGINVMTVRKAGDVKFRWPWSAHRIELTAGECWTLFITGPRLRRCGFHCPRGWVWWQDFVAENGPRPSGPRSSTVGRGCGESA